MIWDTWYKLTVREPNDVDANTREWVFYFSQDAEDAYLKAEITFPGCEIALLYIKQIRFRPPSPPSPACLGGMAA